jgi:hypothetical protein
MVDRCSTAGEHGGLIPGYRSYILRMADEHLLVVILANGPSPARIGAVAAELAGIVVGDKK